MNTDYEVRIFKIETSDGVEYSATIPELKGCVGAEDSYEEALSEVLENKDIYLEVLAESGKEIPIPKSMNVTSAS